MLSASTAAARESAGMAPCLVSATTVSGGASATESIGVPAESRATPSESAAAGRRGVRRRRGIGGRLS